MKTYAWIKATANSSTVNRIRIINVIKAVVILILISAKVAPPIKWISRCPAVIFAVSRTANAIGWINRLIVSMIISMGIKGSGVPWGKKCARDAFVLWRKPKITVPAQRGIAMPRFIDSWVVGVKEWGNKPNRFVEPINIISEISMSVQVCPFLLWIVIICLVVIRINHCWIETKRLLTSRPVDGNNILGNIIMSTTIGNPIIVGVIKEANKFSFIWFLRGLNMLVF